jgi:hypothetical protein
MGYLYNHLATVICAAFAAVLTGLWFIMDPLLNFIFMMAVPIMWFITIICWVVQLSNNFMEKYHGSSKTSLQA